MFKRKDDIKTFLVIAIVCIVCVVLILVLNHKSNVEKIESVNEYNVFFANVNYVNDYFNYIASNDKEAVYDLLDNKYIKDNEITYENVLDKIGNYSINCSLGADSMEFFQSGDNFIYYIKGKLYENVFEGKNIIDDDFSIILISDIKNSSYSLYPVNDSNYENVLNSIRRINIKSNNHNHIDDSESISKEQICVIYLADFMDSITIDINESYNLLSNKMKNIYTTVDKYSAYINDNINLMSSVADKCKLDEIDDRRVYSVIDSNENIYVFTEETIMNYKIDFYLKEASVDE